MPARQQVSTTIGSHGPLPMARGRALGACIVPIPGAKSRRHLLENLQAADIDLTDAELAEIDRVAPPGAATGTRYPTNLMHRLNV